MLRSAVVALAASLAVAACHSGGAPFRWSVPQGWKAETIPFPLDFAPDVPHRGVEEVRFEPGFFDPSAEAYFTYSFAWVLDETRAPAPSELAAELKRYFLGLARAVGQDKSLAVPESAFDAKVEADAEAPAHYHGVVHSLDPFNAGRPVVLTLDAVTLACGQKAVLLVSLSPHATTDATYQGLLAQRATFTCSD